MDVFGCLRQGFFLNLSHHQMTDSNRKSLDILHPETGCKISLAVKIHCKHLLTNLSQRISQIEGGNGFSNAALK